MGFLILNIGSKIKQKVKQEIQTKFVIDFYDFLKTNNIE